VARRLRNTTEGRHGGYTVLFAKRGRLGMGGLIRTVTGYLLSCVGVGIMAASILHTLQAPLDTVCIATQAGILVVGLGVAMVGLLVVANSGNGEV
jgi:hypothetical protein